MVPPNKVGRPPEKDSRGKRIKKSVISINIAQGLIDFLDDIEIKNPKFNRSQFFTRVATALYVGEVCHFCYGQKIDTTSMGTVCKECSYKDNAGNMVWKYLEFNPCPNCETPYDYYNQVKWGGDPKRRGCSQPSCFDVEELSDEMLERLKEEEEEDKKEEAFYRRTGKDMAKQ